MKIKFATDRINEYHNGSFHATNDGSPIEVSSDLGNELIENAKHLIDGEWVPVFEKASDKAKKEEPASETEVSTEEKPTKKK